MFSVLEMLIDSINNHKQRPESVGFIPIFQVTDSLLSQHLNFFSLCHLTCLSSLLLKSNLDFFLPQQLLSTFDFKPCESAHDFPWIFHPLVCYGAEMRHLHQTNKVLGKVSMTFSGCCHGFLLFSSFPVCDYQVTNDNSNNQFLIDYFHLWYLWVCFPPPQPFIYD